MSRAARRKIEIPLELQRDDLHVACDVADRALAAVDAKFDYLLCVSPTNASDAMLDWFAKECDGEPEFHYRPLNFDPAELRRELHAIELTHIHEPLVEGLLLEKRHELDLQLQLIEQRGTNEFRATSEHLYGSVSDALLSAARTIVDSVRKAKKPADLVGADELREHACMLVDTYQQEDAEFAPDIEVRPDVTGLMVSYPKLMIDSHATVSLRRVEPLMAHEVSIHLVTGHNGAKQPLSLFASGLAGYEEIQEGLGVFAEWAVGGLYASRLRLIAARVIAVRMMLDGADFVHCYHELKRNCGIDRRTSFRICSRVFRSGGFAKDAIYLRGFFRVMEFLSEGGDLAPYWMGKIAPVHVPVVKELAERGLAAPGRLVPEFLGREETKARIDDYVAAPSPTKWLSPEPESFAS